MNCYTVSPHAFYSCAYKFNHAYQCQHRQFWCVSLWFGFSSCKIFATGWTCMCDINHDTKSQNTGSGIIPNEYTISSLSSLAILWFKLKSFNIIYNSANAYILSNLCDYDYLFSSSYPSIFIRVRFGFV